MVISSVSETLPSNVAMAVLPSGHLCEEKEQTGPEELNFDQGDRK